jgi:hypothetical protein
MIASYKDPRMDGWIDGEIAGCMCTFRRHDAGRRTKSHKDEDCIVQTAGTVPACAAAAAGGA